MSGNPVGATYTPPLVYTPLPGSESDESSSSSSPADGVSITYHDTDEASETDETVIITPESLARQERIKNIALVIIAAIALAIPVGVGLCAGITAGLITLAIITVVFSVLLYIIDEWNK